MVTNQRVTLLVVEDNPADVALLRYALIRSPLRIDVHVVEDGVQAMAFLQHQEPYTTAPHPHLLLLDLNLPKKNGHAVLAEIKTRPQLKQLPVIIFSSSANPDDIDHSYALGANAYLTKPLMLEGYFALVDQFVQFWCHHAELPSNLQPEDRSRTDSW